MVGWTLFTFKTYILWMIVSRNWDGKLYIMRNIPLSNDITNKELWSKVYKKHLTFNDRKTNQRTWQPAQCLNRYSTNKDIAIKKKHMEICCISKMQVTTIAIYLYCLVEWPKSRNMTISYAKMWNIPRFHLFIGNANGTVSLRDTLMISFRTKHTFSHKV